MYDSAIRALFGRDRELADLEVALAGAMIGRGSVALLSGNVGIGKTRLADALAERARTKGCDIVWGRAWEVEGAPACWLWAQVVAACARTVAGAAFLERDPHAADLAPLRSSTRASTRFDDAELELLRLAAALVELLRALSDVRPLVLVLDDLHCVDLATVNLLRLVTRELRGLRVLVIGTYRDVEARRVPAISAALAHVAREGIVRPLRGLDESAVAACLADGLGAPAPPALLASVYAHTEGNPLFIEALIQVIAARGDVARGIDDAAARGLALPDTIRETVEEMLARLGLTARAVLETAAVLGRSCALPILQRVCDRPIPEVMDAIAEAAAAGVVDRPPRSSDDVRFAHVLIREVLYQAIPSGRRIRLHRSAAAILCELYAADLDAHVAEIAHHFFEGAPLGAWEPAVEYAARAGRRAMDMFAFDVAAHHFERGLAALEGGSLTDPDRRAELQWRLGVARARLGDMAAARVHCEYAAEVARQAGRPDLFADAVLALGAELVPGMIDVRLIDMLEAALQPTLVDPARRALVMARLAAAMTPTLARDRPLQLARSALATARTLGDPRTLAQVVAIARSVLTPADPLDERIALDDELARLARALGDRLLESQAHGRLSLDAIEHGDPAMVDRELVLHRRLVEQLRSPRLQLRAARIRLLWATLTERDDELSAAQAEVRILADQLDDPGGRASLIVNQVFRRWLACELDDDSAARTLLEQLGSAQLARLVPRDLAIAAAGRVELDGPRIATVRQVLRALGPASAVLMMPAVLATGDPALLGAIYDGMLPYAASNPVHMAALASAGPASYHLALLARSRGDREQAAAHFAEALAASTRSGFPGYARRCQRELEAVPQHATTAAVASPLALPSATPLPDPPPTLVQDGETWLLTHGARRVRLKSTKGVCYLAALLDKPGRDLFVGDLIRLGHHPPGAGELEAGSALREAATVAGLGGAGEMLDAKARQAYRQRLDQLSDALEDAEARSDRDAVERLEHERSMLGRELARAVGLGGRGRRAGDPSERARINVQRRLRDVLDRVLQLDPVLGRHLDLHVKTGTFCTWKA